MSQSGKDTAKQILRGLGALVFIVAIVWVGMQSFRVLPSVRQLFANAFVSVQSFFSPEERIVVSVLDSQVIVDEPFSLTWEHRGKDTDGSYTMIYECRDTVHLARVSATGESTLFCNTEIPLLADETSLSLIAHGDVVGAIDVPFLVRFTQNNTSIISEEGATSIRVQDERFDTGIATSTDTVIDTPATSSTPTNPSTPVAGTPTTITIPIVTNPVSDPNGEADFTIRLVAVGLVDKNSGAFSERNEIPKDLPSNKRGAVKFEIENKGTKKTGDDWNFSAKLPTSPSYTYTSPSQQDLYPGDKIEFIIGFDKIVNKDEAIYTIIVDPKDEVDESNEKNNTLSRTLEIDRD